MEAAYIVLIGKLRSQIRLREPVQGILHPDRRQHPANRAGLRIAGEQRPAVGCDLRRHGHIAEVLEGIIPFPVKAALHLRQICPFGIEPDEGGHGFFLWPVPAVAGYGEWKGLAEAGHIRVLATSAPERFDDKTVPILKEAGLDIVFQNWRGVFAAPGAPPHAIEWWSNLLREMTLRPEWTSFLAGKGWEDGYLDSEEFAALIDREETLYRATLQQLGIGGSAGGNSPVGPWAFPKAVAALGLAAGAGVVAEHLRAGPAAEVVPAGLEDDDEGGGALPLWSRFVAGALLIPLFIAALHFAGFLIATPVFVLAVCVMMRSTTLKWDAIAGIGLTAATWLLFTELLHVALP